MEEFTNRLVAKLVSEFKSGNRAGAKVKSNEIEAHLCRVMETAQFINCQDIFDKLGQDLSTILSKATKLMNLP